MSLIEGVGDEVLQFFILLILLVIGILAWWSTQISDRPLIRTVLILERRGTRQTSAEEPVAGTAARNNDEHKNDNAGEAATVNGNEEEAVTTDPIESAADFIAATEIDTGQSQSTFENENENEQGEASDLQHSISTPESLSSSESHGIRIRLMYLNDEQKLVDGNLDEQLGEFKRRHFSLELSGRKLVRLIFNGQLLGQDSWTLGHYGLFDNCVVHCLVHNARTPPPSPDLSTRNGSVRTAFSTWALSNILMAGLSVLLALAWYGRYHYPHLYTTTTTVALVGLTGIFTVSVLGINIPDTAEA